MIRTILIFCMLTILDFNTDRIFPSDSSGDCISEPTYELTGDIHDSCIIPEGNEIITCVNEFRTAKGLSPLTVNERLSEAAYIRCGEIMQYMSHYRPDGRYCSSIYTDMSIPVRLWGENLAAGYSTASRVVQEWINSSSHCDNLLNPDFKSAGVAHISTDTGYEDYWVLLFSD